MIIGIRHNDYLYLTQWRFVFVNMNICICHNGDLYLSKWVFVFVSIVICICICYNAYWYFSQCLSLFVKSHNDYLCLPQPICNYHNHIFIFVVILPSYFHFQLDAYSNVQYFLGHSSIYKGEEHIIPACGLSSIFSIGGDAFKPQSHSIPPNFLYSSASNQTRPQTFRWDGRCIDKIATWEG